MTLWAHGKRVNSQDCTTERSMNFFLLKTRRKIQRCRTQDGIFRFCSCDTSYTMVLCAPKYLEIVKNCSFNTCILEGTLLSLIEKWMSGLYHIQLSSRLPHAKVKNALEMHTVYSMFWRWIQEDQLSDSATWCLRSVLGWLWLRRYSGSRINVPMPKCPWAFFAVGVCEWVNEMQAIVVHMWRRVKHLLIHVMAGSQSSNTIMPPKNSSLC